MTDSTPATVAVPVELLERFKLENERRVLTGTEKELIGFIPKPKPRLVAVDLDNMAMSGPHQMVDDYLSAQPDLLTVLDEVIDKWREDDFGTDIRLAIRATLGVTG